MTETTPSNIEIHELTFIEILDEVSSKYGINCPRPFTLLLERSWQDDLQGRITFRADYAEITGESRRALKRAFSLDVPSWQEDWENKDLRGEIEVSNWAISVRLISAVRCEIVRWDETETPKHKTDLAEKLDKLNAKQMAYLFALHIASLRAPGKKPVLRCKPA